jgi:hypothetical protein
MTTNAINMQPVPPSRLPYAVLVEQTDIGDWVAEAVGWANCQAGGGSREEALEHLQQILSDRVSRAEVVYLELPLANNEHPWLKYAGMYENDPLFDQVLAEIAVYRQGLDAEREELSVEE